MDAVGLDSRIKDRSSGGRRGGGQKKVKPCGTFKGKDGKCEGKSHEERRTCGSSSEEESNARRKKKGISSAEVFEKRESPVHPVIQRSAVRKKGAWRQFSVEVQRRQ